MNHMPRLSHTGRVLLLLTVLWTAALSGAFAQAARPAFKAGELILYCQPGTPQADVTALANMVQAQTVVPLLLKDCYQVILPAAQATNAATLAAVATLKTDARVHWVGPNRYFYKHQITPPSGPKVLPNDPLFSKLWGMVMINMPWAWTIEKGELNSNVCVIDDGFDTKHEDLIGQFLPDSYDFGDNDSDPDPDPGVGAAFQHGVHVSGTIDALANNGKGVAGVDWQNIKILGLKAQPKGTDGFPGTALINSWNYLAQKAVPDHIVACNMSFGGAGDPNDTSDPEYVACKACYDAGVIMLASAGNDNADNHQDVPCGYAFCVTISALGPGAKKAVYSSFGKVDIAAPGGDPTVEGDPGQILSTMDSTYEYLSGTSMACPHAVGVAALLRSVPGTTRDIAIQAMKDGANKTGLTTFPDPVYGYGILDAYNSVLKVAVRAIILTPVGVDPQGNTTDPSGVAPPTETVKPTLSFQIANVPLANLKFQIDTKTFAYSDLSAGTVAGASNLQITGDSTSDHPQYVISFRYIFPSVEPFQHTIIVTGNNPSANVTSTDTRFVTVQPHTLPTGLSFISIPYYESPTNSPTGSFRDAFQLLGNQVTLYRWTDALTQNTGGQPVTLGRYTTLVTGGSDPLSALASFRPPDVIPVVGNVGSTTDARPVGLAWFLRAPSGIPVVTYGVPFTTQVVSIPLHEGWNMVGDPYPFAIPFNTAEIQTSSGTTLTVQQAVDQKLILPEIYTYVGTDYQFLVLPNGIFEPWQGHWLYVVPKNPANLSTQNTLTLVLSPVQSSSSRAVQTTRAASGQTPPAVSGAGSWVLSLTASTRDLTDSHNYIGISSNATDGDDLTKVPKPPKPTPFVSLGLVRQGSAAGVYAQDLRAIGPKKTWSVVVLTDQTNADVTLTWPEIQSVPKHTRLVLTDQVTGQTVDMRRQSSYQFNTGRSAGTHNFTLSAMPSTLTGRALMTNIFINPSVSTGGRGVATYQIGYTVFQDVQLEASILNLSGRVLSVIGTTRAVTAGDNTVTWNGRDNAGNPVPAGTYMVQLRAMTADGEVTREIRPLLITGR